MNSSSPSWDANQTLSITLVYAYIATTAPFLPQKNEKDDFGLVGSEGIINTGLRTGSESMRRNLMIGTTWHATSNTTFNYSTDVRAEEALLPRGGQSNISTSSFDASTTVALTPRISSTASASAISTVALTPRISSAASASAISTSSSRSPSPTPSTNIASLHNPSHDGMDMGDPIIASPAGGTLPVNISSMNTSGHSKSMFFMEVLEPYDGWKNITRLALNNGPLGDWPGNITGNLTNWGLEGWRSTDSKALMLAMLLFTSAILVFLVALLLVGCSGGVRRARGWSSPTENHVDEYYAEIVGFGHDDKEKVW